MVEIVPYKEAKMKHGNVGALQEPKAQRWRALAHMHTGEEALVYVGGSIAQVRENYADPWFDLFDEEVRDTVKEISLQKWLGPPDRGEWVTQYALQIPTLGVKA